MGDENTDAVSEEAEVVPVSEPASAYERIPEPVATKTKKNVYLFTI